MSKNNELKPIGMPIGFNTLKTFVEGKNGEIITLVDIGKTASILENMRDKCNSIVVTKENFKTAAKVAEREIREARLAISKIQKSNNSILNQAKKQQKEVFECLIAITSKAEDRIKSGIKAIEKEIADEKQAVKDAEAKRLAEEQKAAHEVELKLVELIADPTQESLAKYNSILGEMLGKEGAFMALYGEYMSKINAFEQAVKDAELAELKRLEELKAKRIADEQAKKEQAKKDAELEELRAKQKKQEEELRLLREESNKAKQREEQAKNLRSLLDEYEDLKGFAYHSFEISDKNIKNLKVAIHGIRQEKTAKEAKKRQDDLEAKKRQEELEELIAKYDALGGSGFVASSDNKAIEELKHQIAAIETVISEESTNEVKKFFHKVAKECANVSNIVDKSKFKHETSREKAKEVIGALRECLKAHGLNF